MIQVVEASQADFSEVYRLLQQLNNTTIVKNTWGKIFANPFQSERPPGFVLKDEDNIVGFFGTIYSKRNL